MNYFVFSSGVQKLSGQPGMSDNVVFYNGSYYAIDCAKEGIQQSKTESENTLVLTTAGIAMELRRQGVTSGEGKAPSQIIYPGVSA